jgi:hypothetical protein
MLPRELAMMPALGNLPLSAMARVSCLGHRQDPRK